MRLFLDCGEEITEILLRGKNFRYQELGEWTPPPLSQLSTDCHHENPSVKSSALAPLSLSSARSGRFAHRPPPPHAPLPRRRRRGPSRRPARHRHRHPLPPVQLRVVRPGCPLPGACLLRLRPVPCRVCLLVGRLLCVVRSLRPFGACGLPRVFPRVRRRARPRPAPACRGSRCASRPPVSGRAVCVPLLASACCRRAPLPAAPSCHVCCARLGSARSPKRKDEFCRGTPSPKARNWVGPLLLFLGNEVSSPPRS